MEDAFLSHSENHAGSHRWAGFVVLSTSHEVVDLKKESDQQKTLVAELSLENRVLKKELEGLGVRL